MNGSTAHPWPGLGEAQLAQLLDRARQDRGAAEVQRVVEGTRVGVDVVAEEEVERAGRVEPREVEPGVITLTQPKVPEAKVRGSPEGSQCVLVSPERVPGVRKRVPRGPVGPPPGLPELAAVVVKVILTSPVYSVLGITNEIYRVVSEI